MESDGLYDFVEEIFTDHHRLPTIEEVWDAAHKRGEVITTPTPATDKLREDNHCCSPGCEKPFFAWVCKDHFERGSD
jgi:hypothetical protein